MNQPIVLSGRTYSIVSNGRTIASGYHTMAEAMAALAALPAGATPYTIQEATNLGGGSQILFG